MTKKTTPNEVKMINAILTSEYHNGADNTVDEPVWVDCALEDFGRSAGGIMASLVKKGFAGTDGETCWVTQAGADAVKEGK